MARGRRVPLTERVYDALRHDLAAGLLDDTPLRTERLAARYGVSRTPVREALARLEADGVVRRRDGVLVLFRPDPAELADLYELRTVLESRGFQRIVLGRRLTGHDLTAVGGELRRWLAYRDEPPATAAAAVAADEQFHTALLRAAGNAALVDALAAVHLRLRPIRAAALTRERVAAMIGEHIAIAELVVAGESDRAHTALATHIRAAHDLVGAPRGEPERPAPERN
ncbi:GntR family transcriptional regulator [Nocardia thailandica]